MGEYLTGDTDHRRAVDHGIGKTGYQIGSTRSAGGEHRTDFTGSPCKPLRGVDGTLFMPDKDMRQLIMVIIQRIIDRHDRTSGITKYCGDIFGYQGAHHGFATAYLFRGDGRSLFLFLCERFHNWSLLFSKIS